MRRKKSTEILATDELLGSERAKEAYEQRELLDSVRLQLRELLERQDPPMNQQALAAKLGVSEGRVSQFLAADQNWTLRSLVTVARALGAGVRVELVADGARTEALRAPDSLTSKIRILLERSEQRPTAVLYDDVRSIRETVTSGPEWFGAYGSLAHGTLAAVAGTSDDDAAAFDDDAHGVPA